MINLLKNFAWLVLTVSCLFTLTGRLGAYHWALDATSHFPVQYLLIELLGVVALWKKRKKLLAGLVLALAVFNIGVIAPYFTPHPPADETQLAGRLKILHMNVFVYNPDKKTALEVLKNTDADIISLQEINKPWRNALKQSGVLAKRYPYHAVHPHSLNGLYSKTPLKNVRILPVDEGLMTILGEDNMIGKRMGSIIYADINVGGETVTIINFHPPVPLAAEYAKGMGRYTHLLAQPNPAVAPNHILLGDFNTTPWSVNYHTLINSNLNLHDTRTGWGFTQTWPSYLPLFFIPIDHILASKNFVTLQHHVGPFTGSDHLPIYVELGLKRK